MLYQCPKGHQSTDSDYCSECGALIGESKLSNIGVAQDFQLNTSSNSSGSGVEICPDCGTPKVGDARFCEVCRHDFQENKTGMAEAIVASQKPAEKPLTVVQATEPEPQPPATVSTEGVKAANSKPDAAAAKEAFVISDNLNVIIAVDKVRASSCDIETAIKPDSKERVFPLDLDENLVGRRSVKKGIYPEIEINDPGVSHRHLKFIKQTDGRFAVLELGSSNGTELNGEVLEPGVTTAVKAGDELTIGIWTQLKLMSR